MKALVAAIAAVLLAGCGLDAASTAATGAAIKKQELDQGKKTMEQAQQKINDALQLQQQRSDANEEKDK